VPAARSGCRQTNRSSQLLGVVVAKPIGAASCSEWLSPNQSEQPAALRRAAHLFPAAASCSDWLMANHPEQPAAPRDPFAHFRSSQLLSPVIAQPSGAASCSRRSHSPARAAASCSDRSSPGCLEQPAALSGGGYSLRRAASCSGSLLHNRLEQPAAPGSRRRRCSPVRQSHHRDRGSDRHPSACCPPSFARRIRDLTSTAIQRALEAAGRTRRPARPMA